MKQSTRFCALLLAMLLVLSLAACANNNTTTTPADDSTPEAVTPDTPANDTTDSQQETPAETPDTTDEPVETADPVDDTYGYTGSTGGIVLPICDEMTTLTGWKAWSSTYLDNPNEVACAIEIEKRTNVHIEWEFAASQVAKEKYNLMMASTNYPDLLWVNLSYITGGVDKMVEDEVFVDAANYFDITPNFVRLINANAETDRQCKTDTGVYFFGNIQSGCQPAWCGPMVRTDWLTDCGLDTPVTYEDWHEMLVAFKDQKNAISPLLLSNTGYDSLGFGLTSGFDTAVDFYNCDGTVRYGILDDTMRDYVQPMANWYAEGLIANDFVSLNAWTDGQAMFLNNETGAFSNAAYTSKLSYEALHTDENATLDAVPFPSITADRQGTLHFRRVNREVGQDSMYITTAAVDRGVDEIAAKWMDYRYSDQGAWLRNYGIEGETWELGEDGMPHFTDFFLHNDTYLVSEMTGLYCEHNTSGYYMWIRENDMYPADVLAAYDIWGDSATGDWVMPDITMTTAEGEAYAAKYSDIQSYVNEMILKFIVGNEPMSSWDSFVAEVKAMGIEDCIAIKQAALDRYLAR